LASTSQTTKAFFGERILLRTSSHHFEDINLLGTDVLGCARLTINCPKKLASLTRTTPDRNTPDAFWVTLDGATFEVTPSKNNVDALKDAVKAKMQLSGPAPLLTAYVFFKMISVFFCCGRGFYLKKNCLCFTRHFILRFFLLAT